MAVSDTQKVDLLYKQALRVARTDGAKDPTGESIVSSLLVRGDKVWINASSIPSTPAAVAGIVQAYVGNAGAIQCTADNTTAAIGGVYPAWLTSQTNWIPPEFGALYSVAVYVDTTGSTTPTTTGTQIFAAGNSGTGEYYFDYSAGVLNFIGGTIPAILTAGKSIFIVGYRYIGSVGLNSNVALGNTTVTGFINVSSTANIGGDITARSNVTVNGAVLIANTLAVGNTETTGYINVSSTANIGGVVSARANVAVNGALIVSNAAALGNTTVTGFINVSSTANVGGDVNLRGNAAVNGALTVSNVAALGNTTVTGFINVSSTANVGGDVNLRGNAAVNGALTVSNTAALGNTTVTGFINVSSTANVGGDINLRGNAAVNGALTVSNTAALGNTTVTGFINVSSTAAVGNTTISGYSNTTTLDRIGTARTTQSVNPSTNVAAATDTITITGHGFVNNDVVMYSVAAGNTAMTNLTSGSLYFVRDADANTFKLASSQNGTAIDLAVGANETGHRFVTSETLITPFGVSVGNSSVNAVVNSSIISTSGNGSFGGNVVVTGNLTVFGTTVTVTSASFTTSDNLLYLNEAKTATVTGASSNGTHFLYTANNTFTVGMVVGVSGMNPTGYNIASATAAPITLANTTHFAVANTSSPGAFVSGGTARAKAAVNPDLGFAGGYNDGVYHHAGFFRDASDGIWKVFDNYDPEPDAAVNIDTTDATFHIANFQANTITANTIGTGNTSVTGYINVSSTANVGGAATLRGDVTVNGAVLIANTLSTGNTTVNGFINVNNTAAFGNTTVSGFANISTTLAAGNTTVTGFINVSSTANVGGEITARSNVTVNGAVSIANTLATGNTTVTGFINVSTTAALGNTTVTGFANISTTLAAGNTTITGFANVSNTLAAGNTSITGFINVSSTANVGGDVNLRGNVAVNGAMTVANVLATGNTSVTGFINVSTTANVGGVVSARANVVVNGALIVANTADVGNTTVTGFVNVSTTANIGGVLSARANAVVNGALIVANTADVGNTTVSGFINVSSSANVGGVVTARANVTVNGALVVANTAALGNTTVSGSLVANNTTIGGYANVIGTPAAFNANTGVNGATEFITTTAAHGFSNGDYVQYAVSAGNTAIGGLSQGGYYYVTNANTTAFTLSASYNGANVDVTATTASETGHTLTPIRVVLATDGSITTTTGVANVASLRVLGTTVANGTVTIANTLATGNTSVTGFINVSTTANVGGAATLRGDVTVNGALVVSNTASLGNTTVNVFAANNSTVTGYINVHGTAATFNANTGVANATEFITTVSAHGFANGDIVRYTVSAGNTALSGLTNATNYYVVNANTTAFNLSSSYGGSAINITAGVSETGHTLTPIRVAVGQDGSITSTTGIANVASLRVLGNAVVNGTATVGANIVLGTTTISANGGVGTTGQFLTSGASGNVYWSTAVTSAAGSNTQIQYNNNGSFGACSAFTFDSSTNTLTTSIISARDMTLTGNLSVNGTLTYINTTNLNIGDNIIVLNADLGAVAPSENAGIEVNRGTSANVSFYWDEGNDRWTAGNTYVDVFRASNTTIVGTLTANAGVGTAGQVLTSGASGNIYWSTVSTTPGGSNSQVAFNDGGAWGFDAGMTYNKTSDTLSLTGALGVGANVTANTSAVVVGNSKLESTALTLGGTVSANGGNGTAGQVLVSGGAGNVYWGAGGASVTVGATPPVSPSANSLWWDSSTGVLRIYYNDGDTSQWVDSVPQVATLQAVTAGGNSTTIAVGLANTTITGFANVVGTLQVSSTFAANGGVGTAGQVLTSGASGNVYWSTIAAAVGGSNTQVQFNDSGSANGAAGFTFSKSSNTLTVANTIVTNNLTANGLITANGATGTAGQVLVSGGAGNVYWGAAGVTAGGTDTQIQFNDGGTALGGDAGLTYNKTTDTMTVLGGVNTNGSISVAGAGKLNLGANAAAAYATANAYIQYNSSNNSIDFVIV